MTTSGPTDLDACSVPGSAAAREAQPVDTFCVSQTVSPDSVALGTRASANIIEIRGSQGLPAPQPGPHISPGPRPPARVQIHKIKSQMREAAGRRHKNSKRPYFTQRLRHRGPKQFLMIRRSQADKRTPHIHKPGFL